MKLNSDMSTRSPKTPPKSLGESMTEFQLYKDFSYDNLAGMYDYTSHRLERFLKVLTDPGQISAVMQVLSDYRAGKVAVAWKEGRPVWLHVTKESSG